MHIGPEGSLPFDKHGVRDEESPQDRLPERGRVEDDEAVEEAPFFQHSLGEVDHLPGLVQIVRGRCEVALGNIVEERSEDFGSEVVPVEHGVLVVRRLLGPFADALLQLRADLRNGLAEAQKISQPFGQNVLERFGLLEVVEVDDERDVVNVEKLVEHLLAPAQLLFPIDLAVARMLPVEGVEHHQHMVPLALPFRLPLDGVGRDVAQPVLELRLGLILIHLRAVVRTAHHHEECRLPCSKCQMRKAGAVQHVELGLPREIPHPEEHVPVHEARQLDLKRLLFLGLYSHRHASAHRSLGQNSGHPTALGSGERFLQRRLAHFGMPAEEDPGASDWHVGLVHQHLQALDQLQVLPPEALGVVFVGRVRPDYEDFSH
ncbi:hypothetical protein Mapa_003674 [Marchantia paleacea]|nr:hypothetical protein Mapa_003674 [Marchantia paleacea]